MAKILQTRKAAHLGVHVSAHLYFLHACIHTYHIHITCTHTCTHILRTHTIYYTYTHIRQGTHTHAHKHNNCCTYHTHGGARRAHTHTPSLTSQVCGNRSGFREAQCQGNLSTHTQGPHNAKPIGLINSQQGATTSIKTKCWRPCLGKTNPGIGNMVSLLP